MNEETTPQSVDQTGEPAVTPPASTDTPAAPPLKSASLPPWLPLFLLAVLPAAVVGILVYALAGGGGGGSNEGVAGIVDGFLRLAPDANTQVDSFKGELPPDYPSDFPIYRNAKVVVSFQIVTQEGTNIFAVMTTKDSAEDVFDFYREQLDDEPWQVEVGRASDEFTGLRFLRPDNADVSGDVTIHHSELDNSTAIYVSYEDVSAAIAPGSSSPPTGAGVSRPLPAGFPNDVPIYSGRAKSIVVDTYFERSGGGQVFIVSFLTRDTEDDVIEFYTDEFKGRGWTTTDSTQPNSGFALSMDFSDDKQSLQGQITADSYENDPDYTRVDMVVQVTAARSRGN